VLGMDLKVGDTYKCPEGHKAKIVWIREDGKVIGVRCPREHFSKIVAGKEVYTKDFVFLIEV
jgi:hypothetical protein